MASYINTGTVDTNPDLSGELTPMQGDIPDMPPPVRIPTVEAYRPGEAIPASALEMVRAASAEGPYSTGTGMATQPRAYTGEPKGVNRRMFDLVKSRGGRGFTDPAEMNMHIETQTDDALRERGIDPDSAMGKATKAKTMADVRQYMQESGYIQQFNKANTITNNRGDIIEPFSGRIIYNAPKTAEEEFDDLIKSKIGSSDMNGYRNAVKALTNMPGKVGDTARKKESEFQKLEKEGVSIENLKKTGMQKDRALVEKEPMKDEDLGALVDVWQATGKDPSFGMGQNSNREKYLAMKAKRIREAGGVGDIVSSQATIKAATSELSALQNQRGKIMSFAETAEKNLELASKLSKEVDRSDIPLLNNAIITGKIQLLGDPKARAYVGALRVAINEYAKVTASATGGGVTSDSARKEIEELLSQADTPEMFDEVIKTLKVELSNRKYGYDHQIQSIQSSLKEAGDKASGKTIQSGKKTAQDLLNKYKK